MKNFLLIMQLVPIIIGIVKTIEEAIPIPGQGKAKLDAVLEMIMKVYGPLSTDIIPQVTAIISVIVNLFNTTGVFKKS